MDQEFQRMDEKEQQVRSVMTKKGKADLFAAWRSFIMTDEPEKRGAEDQPPFGREVGAKVARKLKARRPVHPGV